MSRPVADGQGLLVGMVDLDRRPDAARRARRVLANRLAGYDGLVQDRVDDCLFLVSEVVANVIQHADTEACPLLRVVWTCHGDILRTEVYDPDPVIPSVGTVSLDAEDGRGLWLVAAMADRWAAEPVPATGDLWWSCGKVVWFAIRGVWDTRDASRVSGLHVSGRAWTFPRGPRPAGHPCCRV